MIFLSLVLVIVAAVTLVLGVFQDGLVLIYVSIATCVAAMAVLGVGVLLRRREVAAAGPASYGDGARDTSALARTPVAAGRVADRTTQADHEDAGEDADAAFRRPTVTDDEAARPVAERPVAKRAVAKRAVATRAESATAAAVVGGTAVAPAPVPDEPAAADAPPAPRGRKATAKKATAKKATARKATARKATAEKASTRTATTATATAAADAAVREPSGSTAVPAATSARPVDVLSGVRGLGPTKRARLMERFGSVEALADATVQEISGVPGIGVGTAQAIKDALD